MSRQGISGIILAGGLGRRMGGVDKGLQLLNGRPLVAHVAERLAPQVDELLINANQNADLYAAFAPRIVADRIPGFAGPLAGLHAALAAASQPLVATAPCDSPFLPDDLVSRLLAALGETNCDIAIARTGDQVHPVFCLCRRQLLPHLEAFLNAGNRRFGQWCASLRAIEVAFDDKAAAFENINTRDELARFEKSR